MINQVISRSQQPGNICVMGDTEQDHMGRIADRLTEYLLRDGRFNVLNIQPLNLGTDANLAEICRQSNDFITANGGAGYHLALHSDAGYSGHGASAFYFSDAGLCYVRPVYEAMCKLTPWQDMSLKPWKGLYELHNTKAVAALVEVSFHDDPKQAKWIHEKFNMIAYTIYTGIVKGAGLQMQEVNINFDDALKIVFDAGIISDVEYWRKSADYNPNNEHLFTNMAKYIIQGG